MPSDESPNTPITIRDIAEYVGVSRSAVSIVIRGAKGVGDETRERVLAAMDKLGYVYNRGAARMRSRQTNTIGLFVPQTTNPYYWEFVSGVDEVLSASRLVPFLANTNESPERQQNLLERMREHAVDGIIISPAADSPASLMADLKGSGLPFVQAVRHVSLDDSDIVAVDSRRGVALVTEYLIDLGHRRIALIGGEENMSVSHDRRDAFTETMRKRGLNLDGIRPAPSTFPGGLRTMKAMLEMPDPPTAAVCFNDFVAMGATIAIREKGLIVGDDVSVAGFDDIETASQWIPPLTTVAASAHEVGREAARLLLRRIREPAAPPVHVTIPPKLIVRASTAPVR